MLAEMDTSSITKAVRGFRLAAWKLSRQRRTLQWRRVQPEGGCYPAIETQQRLTPWSPPIWLPRLRDDTSNQTST